MNQTLHLVTQFLGRFRGRSLTGGGRGVTLVTGVKTEKKLKIFNTILRILNFNVGISKIHMSNHHHLCEHYTLVVVVRRHILRKVEHFDFETEVICY